MKSLSRTTQIVVTAFVLSLWTAPSNAQQHQRGHQQSHLQQNSAQQKTEPAQQKPATQAPTQTAPAQPAATQPPLSPNPVYEQSAPTPAESQQKRRDVEEIDRALKQAEQQKPIVFDQGSGFAPSITMHAMGAGFETSGKWTVTFAGLDLALFKKYWIKNSWRFGSLGGMVVVQPDGKSDSGVDFCLTSPIRKQSGNNDGWFESLSPYYNFRTKAFGVSFGMNLGLFTR